MGYNFSKRTEHFTLPKQWASMRVAKKLEQETGKKIIHFEKGDYQELTSIKDSKFNIMLRSQIIN